jgi:chemotaxis protein CheD
MVKKIIISIGDICVSREPAILQTVLGSCVSTCLWDERSRVGGMNHFMLPKSLLGPVRDVRLGPESIEKLVHEMVRMGADRRGLRAKIFGGGRILRGLNQNFDVGTENVIAARERLKRLRIPIIKEFTATAFGVKLVFYTATGRAFLKRLEDVQQNVL